ncbi:MAG: hypothetical protein LBP53_02660 [Candidatus Peribacteria bacterium]|jgi:hypothetical protein|nr:hypothetical protein [Candidatus Peribacteria bacterium]
MKTVYNEITAYELPNLPNTSPHPKLFTLLPIATSPARNAQYAYRLPFMKGEKEGFSSATLLSLWNMLGIANNLSSSQLQERTKRLTTSSSGRKQKQGVYFFRHQHQLTIIKPHSPASAQPFWKHSLTEETIIKKC